MSILQRVSATTIEKLIPNIADTMYQSTPIVNLLLAKGKLKKFDSYQMKQSMKIADGIDSIQFVSGLETLNRDIVTDTAQATFTPKYATVPCTITYIESTQNSGESKVIDLVKYKMRSTADSFAQGLASVFYNNGTDSTKFTGINGIVDDGTILSSYFGLSRSTYTTLQGEVDSSSVYLTQLKLASLWSSVSDGSLMPTVALTTVTVHDLYEQIKEASTQTFLQLSAYSNGLTGTMGYRNLTYKGVEVISDRACPTGIFYMLNMDHLAFYGQSFGLDNGMKELSLSGVDQINGNDYKNVNFTAMTYRPFIASTNQFADSMDIALGGEIFSDNPKRNGKMTGITSVA